MKKYLTFFMSIMLVVFALVGCQEQKTESKMQTNESNTAEAAEPKTDDSSTAVVYFSATGTTAKVADNISQILNVPCYEIVPENVYSLDDLNYNNDDCRANKEMKDESARPAISNDLSAVDNCTTLYVGYPIWWGTAPRIINTFLDNHNMNGKTIYTFCTSGSSDIEQSISDLKKNYTDINIAGGQRFGSSASKDDVQKWLNSLGE